jgi:carbamoyltransferase
MYILGLNAYHADSSACLVKDGTLVAAVEEERLNRIKHWSGFPAEAIRYCLREGNISLRDVDVVAMNQDRRANLGRKLVYTLLKRPSWKLIAYRLRYAKKWISTDAALQSLFPNETLRAAVRSVEHHRSHMASAFHVSPFQRSVVVSVDGFGDFASAAWGVGNGSALTIDGRVYFPHSLGLFYEALTQYLGFPHYGDEYKIMGLAPYGEPRYLEKMREIVRLQRDGTYELELKFFRHHKENVDYSWDCCAPSVGTLFTPALEALLGPRRKPEEPLDQRHKDIARSVQAMYEEAFFHLLNAIQPRYGIESLSLAGGCAMNSVANGKISSRTPFKKVYIQSAAGDAGGAIGAAFSAWSEQKNGARGFVMDHAYWGPHFDNAQVGELLRSKSAELNAQHCTVEQLSDEEKLCDKTAEAVAAGRVVGWFQGRLEWGPRALGNRSIVCDPRRSDMKDLLNLKIKRRESFRPFAPSILREHVSEWFETDADVYFMMQVFQIRPEQRARIPAVTHVDGSGRLQTVHQKTNPRYYRLIERFYARTGIPMVLNTSFNENEPVVCTPLEALDCFLRTKMDVLVLEDFYISRSAS